MMMPSFANQSVEYPYDVYLRSDGKDVLAETIVELSIRQLNTPPAKFHYTSYLWPMASILNCIRKFCAKQKELNILNNRS